MFFKISECLHRADNQPDGRFTSFLIAPAQSEYTSTFPERSGYSLAMPVRTRCTAISPRSSPLYALAAVLKSAKEPTTLPLPALHSKKKAVEHKSVRISGMYEPSATAIQSPCCIDCTSQSSSPCHRIFFHSHVHPHSLNTSWIVSGQGGNCSRGAYKMTFHTPRATGNTEQINPRDVAGWLIRERVQKFGWLLYLGTCESV